MSPSAVLRRRPVRSPAREHPRPTPSDAPTAMRLVLTHRAEGPARPRRVPRHATSLAPDRQQGRDSSILHSFHIPPQTNRWFHLQEHVQRLQDHPMLESIALESFNLSFPPEDFCSIRGVPLRACTTRAQLPADPKAKTGAMKQAPATSFICSGRLALRARNPDLSRSRFELTRH